MLGCGTLVVESAGERGQLVLRDVPHVEEVQRDVYRLAEADEERAAVSRPGTDACTGRAGARTSPGGGGTAARRAAPVHPRRGGRAAGVSVEYARRLWRAMGFANVGDEARRSPTATWRPSSALHGA